MTAFAAFLMRHGYAVLFGIVLLEQAGLPLPALPVLLAMGALVGAGHFNLAAAILVVVAASLIPDLAWFELGRRHGARMLALLCRISLEPDSCVRRTENVLAAGGARALLFAKFIPGLSTAAPPVAGMLRMRLSRFLLWDTAGAVLWAGSLLAVGYAFSNELERIAEMAARLGGRMVAAVAAGLAGYVLWKYVQRRRFIREIAVARITPEELRRRLDAGEDIVVVDLRHSMEFDAEPAMVPGAIHLLPDELDARHGEIPRDREVVLYCT
jgi:membrane protein DedA with SNARE-associated domain